MWHERETETTARRSEPEPGAGALGPALAAEPAEPETDAVYCPECGMPAWVEWSDTVAGTSGALEHVKVRCFARHWFLMPREGLHG